MTTDGENVNSEGKSGSQERDICRDFLNKICNRGTRCKFYHPPGEDAKEPAERSTEDFNFCIDYQNQGCFRANCRFVHAPQEEVERYRRTGDVSNLLARAIAAVTKADNIQGIPFCKEFQAGRCQRGQRCRYWHVNVELEREHRFSQPAGASAHMEAVSMLPQPLIHHGPPGRRRPAVDDYDAASKRANFGPPPALGPPLGAAPAGMPYAAELERENAELKRELDALRRELQREKDRYDSLLAAISHQPGGASAAPPAPSQQHVPSAYHDPYSASAAPSRSHYPNVLPVPPPKADWYAR